MDLLNSFGGNQAETSAMTKLLQFNQVKNPFTNEMITETEVFGLAGGIGSGFSFCPSIPRHGTGGGVIFVARHNVLSYDGKYQTNLFTRLNQTVQVEQTGGSKKAQKTLLSHLENGRPVMVSTGRTFDYLGGPEAYAPDPCCGHAVVVVSLTNDLVTVSDLASIPITTSANSLAKARATICSHKNRSFAITQSRQPNQNEWIQATAAALKDCAEGLLRCRVKTFSIHGLEKAVKAIPNTKAKSGWEKQFPDGLLVWALHSGFVSIQNSAESRGLNRTLFSQFLATAGEWLDCSELLDLSNKYELLSNDWESFANDCLPEKIPGFSELKAVEREISAHLRGEFESNQYLQLVSSRRSLLNDLTKANDLRGSERVQHLQHLAKLLAELQSRELELAEQLDQLTSTLS